MSRLSQILSGQEGLAYRLPCFFPDAASADTPSWIQTASDAWFAWGQRRDLARGRCANLPSPLRAKAEILCREAYLLGACLWAWNALATAPPPQTHTDLWRWANAMNGFLDFMEPLGQRWAGRRDFFSFCPSDLSLLDEARLLLQEPEPEPSEWNAWLGRVFALQFGRWSEPPEHEEPLPWIERLAWFVPSRTAYYRGVCQLAWQEMRTLDGTNRPPEPLPADPLATRQALDAVAQWCERYLPPGQAEPAPASEGPSPASGVDMVGRTWITCPQTPLIDIGPLPDDLQAALNAAVWYARGSESIAKIAKGPMPSDTTKDTVARMVQTLNRAWNECRAAILAVTQELSAVRDEPASFGPITEPNAHQAALAFGYRLTSEIWTAADLIQWSNALLDPAVRMDPARIVANFANVREKLQALSLPDANAIIAACQVEVAKVVQARRQRAEGREGNGRAEPVNWVGPVPASEVPSHAPEADRQKGAAGPLPQLLCAADLARHLGQPAKRVETFLRRYRQDNPDCCEEVANPRRNEPRYLYRTSDVWPALLRQTQRWAESSDG